MITKHEDNAGSGIAVVRRKGKTQPPNREQAIPLRTEPGRVVGASTGRHGLSSIPAVDTTLACRYELKYQISESKARAIAQFIRPYLPLDRYARLSPNGEYPIASLYLDSEQLHLCRETLEKKKNRFKLRVRSYSDEPDAPVFLEVKRRLNNIIVKSRAKVLHEHVSAVLTNQYLSQAKLETDHVALRQFQFYVKALNAKPMVLIRYMRQAFEGGTRNSVRITFDRRLYYNVTTAPQVRIGGLGWVPIPMNFVILEIKFTANYPAWLGRMVRTFDLDQSAMSKYASSLRQSCMHGFSAPQYANIYELLG